MSAFSAFCIAAWCTRPTWSLGSCNSAVPSWCPASPAQPVSSPGGAERPTASPGPARRPPPAPAVSRVVAVAGGLCPSASSASTSVRPAHRSTIVGGGRVGRLGQLGEGRQELGRRWASRPFSRRPVWASAAACRWVTARTYAEYGLALHLLRDQGHPVVAHAGRQVAGVLHPHQRLVRAWPWWRPCRARLRASKASAWPDVQPGPRRPPRQPRPPCGPRRTRRRPCRRWHRSRPATAWLQPVGPLLQPLGGQRAVGRQRVLGVGRAGVE